MDTIADYDAWKNKAQQSNAAAAGIVLDAVNVKPDEVAGDITLANEFAKSTGKPVPPLSLVTENRSIFQQEIERKKNSTLLSSSPMLAEWLRKPDNAAVARDDLEGLSWFEGFGRGATNSMDRAGERLAQGGNQFMLEQTAGRAQDRQKTFGQLVDDQKLKMNDMQGKPLDTGAGPIEYMGALAHWIDARYADLIGTDDTAAAQQYAAGVNAAQEALAATPKSGIAQAFETEAMVKGATLGQSVSNFAGAFLKNPLGGLSWALETGGESAPQMAAAIAATALTRNPAAGIATMGAGSYATERYTAPADFLAEKGIDLGKPEDVQRLLADPEMMKDAANRGVVRGLIIGAFDAVSGGIAGKALVGNPIIEALAQTAQQAIFGASGEYAARVAAGQPIDWNDIVSEGLAEIASTPVDMGVAGRELLGNKRKAKAAEARSVQIKELADGSKASILRARMPDAFKDFVAKATANGPVENVFVPAGDFAEYFQGAGIDPFELADQLDGVSADDLRTALATGGDLKIPTATYAAKMAGSEHDKFLMENMRFNPDDMTAREAKDFNEKSQEATQEAFAEAERMRAEHEQYHSLEATIYDEMVSRLRVAGRSTDVATSEAMLYPAFYRVMAERSNLTTEEFLARYPLPQVRGEVPQGLQIKNVDALTRTLAEARAQKTVGIDTRQSLLEFIADHGGINDPGGELKARDAEVIAGRGRKKLRLARKGAVAGMRDMLGATGGRKFGADDVALAAIEAGFLADDPTAVAYKAAIENGGPMPDIGAALWAAVDRELAGAKEFSRDQMRDPKVDQGEELAKIEEYLSGLGVSLDDSDEAVRAAIEADQAGEGRKYGQGGVDTESAAFKAWFGDSKVVDAKGKPLVVYHGTPDAREITGDEGRFKSRDEAFFGVENDPNGSFFFTSDQRVARTYADPNRAWDYQNAEPGVVPVYLSVQNPAVIDWGGERWRGTAAAIEKARQDGHDGIIIKNVRDAFNSGLVKKGDVSSTVYVAFSPTQIKSVNNRGTFDPADPRILHQPAYHGTPHLFEKFSLDAMGTGEGAQAFGWGLYFAGKKSIAEYYRDSLSDGADIRVKDVNGTEFDPSVHPQQEVREAALWLEDMKGDASKAISEIERAVGQGFVSDDRGRAMLAYIRGWAERGFSFEKKKGRLFQVDVPDDSELLDWDKSISEQPPGIQEKLASVYEDANPSSDDYDASEPFQTAYYRLVQKFGSDKAASEALRAAGIPGHKFLDGSSRSAGDGSYNYVIYDDSRINVTHYEQSGGPGPRGSIQFPGAGIRSGETIISLFKSADLSTFIHETGHYFLSVMQDLSARGELAGASEPAIPPNTVRLYHSGAVGEGQTGRWVSTSKTYASNYRADLPLFYMDVPESDPRVNNADYPDQGVNQGFTFNFETTPDEAVRLREIPRSGDPATTDFQAVKNWWQSNAADVAKDAMRVMPDVNVTAEDVNAALQNGTTGDVMKDAAIDVGMQEQFARGFEAYLLEGKAPTAELRSAFEKFRAWLVSIYKKVTGLNVAITPELRNVFDRMLATDDELATARQSSADKGPVFATAEEMGLSDADYQAFLRLHDQAHDDAAAKLLAETMAPIKRAQEKWFKDERAIVRDEVEKQINTSPVYRAWEWMGNRRWMGEGKPDSMPDFRLSKDVLVERYGAGVLKTLPRGMQTVYAVEGGLDPDDAAGWFGFASGDAMVKAMEQAPTRKQAIEDQTDRTMFERHGDVLRDGAVEAAALDAVHGDKRAQALATELRAMAEITGSDRGLTHKEAREIARQTLTRTRVRDAINANRYLVAERKAGEEAQKLAATVTRTGLWMAAARRSVSVKARGAVRAGDASAAAAVPVQIDRANESTARHNENAAKLVEAKRRQLLNHALYSEARRIADEVEKAESLVAKLEKATRKIRSGRLRMGEASISGDYVEAIEGIIYGYEFRKVSGRKIDRRAALLNYVQTMTEAGRANELAIPQSVLDDARVTNYRSLTVEHLRGVVDSLKNIEHVARLKGRLLIAGKKRDLAEVTAEVANSIAENVKDRPVSWVKDDGKTAKAREFISGYISSVQTATTILRQMDGRKDLGPTYEALKSDMDAAAYTERDMQKEATEKILDIYSVYTPDEQRQMAVRMVRPELGGQSFSKWNLIAMALNMGNEGNLARLTNEKALMHLTADQVDAVKGMLDKRDWDFVQATWNYIDSFRSKIAERDRRIRGVEPTWVDATPVETPHGTYKGGYYPIKYEGRLGGAKFSSGDNDADILNSMMSGGFSSAQTKDGHLKARGAHVQQSLRLDPSVIAEHANEVIHDLAFSEAVVNTWRILTSNAVQRAMIRGGLDAQYAALKLWVRDVAVGQVSSGSMLAKTVRTLRSGFTYSKLAWKFKTAFLQPLGLMQSAVVVGKRNLAYQMIRYTKDPIAMTTDVLARSSMMWDRRQTFNKDLMDAVAKANLANPTASKIRTVMDDWIIPLSMAGITYSQYYLVDVPTWAAAFQKGMKQFDSDEQKAAQYADMTVQRSQGSGIWSDRSGVERGTLSEDMRQNPFVTLLTTLGSYYFTKMNLIIEKTQGLKAEPISIGSAMSFALDASLLLAGEAVTLALVGAAGNLAFGGDDDGEDKDNVFGTIALDAANTFLAGLPGIRDAASFAQGFDGGTYAAILNTFVKPVQQIGQGDVDKALVKSVINLGGMLTRVPSSQANVTLDALWRSAEGEDVSPMEYIMGRSKK